MRFCEMITTTHLLLRTISTQDAIDLIEVYGDWKVMWLNSNEGVVESIQEMKQWIVDANQNKQQEVIGIIHKQSQKVIGTISIYLLHNGNVEIGYLLHPKYWNQGYMKEALASVLEYLFHVCQMHRISALVTENNKVSQSVLVAYAFQKEGILKEVCLLNDGKYHDCVLYALIKSEYRKLRNELQLMQKYQIHIY